MKKKLIIFHKNVNLQIMDCYFYSNIFYFTMLTFFFIFLKIFSYYYLLNNNLFSN